MDSQTVMSVAENNEFFNLDLNSNEFALLADIFAQQNDASNDASTTTSPGICPWNSSHSNSPLDPLLEHEPCRGDEFDGYFSTNDQQNVEENHLNSIFPMANDLIDGTERAAPIDEVLSWTSSISSLKILIEPKSEFRMRFQSEINPENHRPNRFIQGHSPTERSSYPTVEIPSWIDESRSWYIRVTLITVGKGQNSEFHIHPYPIFASENDVIEVREENSLYFPITRNDLSCRRKSFQILLIQPVQRDLQAHGPLRLFGSNEIDTQQIADSQNVKKFINTFQLWKCRLAFTLIKLQNSNPSIREFIEPAAISKPMADEKRNLAEKTARSPTQQNANQITCVPSESEWHGNTTVVLIFPYTIKKKNFKIYVDFGSNLYIDVLNIRLVDVKTMLIQTPLCPHQWGSMPKFPVSLLVEQDNVVLPPIPFSYISPPSNLCFRCQMPTTFPNNTNKRSRYDDFEALEDGGENLFKSFNKLAIKDEKLDSPIKEEAKSSQSEKQNVKNRSSDVSLATTKYKELNSRFENYLNKLKDAVSKFVRTEDPSLLFRRTRLLLLQNEDASPPLHDAIQCGNVELLEKLFEQIFDMTENEGLLDQKNSHGQTALLLSAQYDRCSLIELILRHRKDLVKQIDSKKNNFLHILIENRHVETIRRSLEILPENLKEKLLNDKNQFNQRPVDIARVHEEAEAIELLTCTKN